MQQQKETAAVERLDLEITDDAFQVFLHKQRYDFALDRLSNKDAVLEMGTGTGYFSCIMANHCQTYAGLEIDPVSCQRVRSRLQGRGEVFEGDAHAMPFANGSYSAVVALEVLEHLSDYRKAVHEIYRCLQPQGKVIVSVPYRRSGGKNSRNVFHVYEPGEGELVETFRKYFGKVEVQYQYFPETTFMSVARNLYLRRVFGLSQIYRDLWKGVPSALEKVKIDNEGKGLKITLMLVASERKSAA